MHICVFAEGCYPYVVGGVSSWLHSLMTSLPEHEFTVVTLASDLEQKGKFKYKLPDNLIEVRENFIDVISYTKGTYKKKYAFTQEDIEQFDALFNGDTPDWDVLVDFVRRNKGRNPQDFIMSRVFYESIISTYEKNHSTTILSDFFWTVRSMVLPLLGILDVDVPEADVYHAISGGYAGVMASVGKITYNKPLIITEHGIYTREREEEIIGADWISLQFKDLWIRYFQSLSKCAYQNADIAITLFEKAKKLQHELGCDESVQRVVPNGVNVEAFAELPKKQFGVGKTIVGAVVRLVPIKDILTMIQSFKIVNAYMPDVEFYIMGPTDESPEYYEECQSIVTALDMDSSITFTGRINIKDYFPMMDINVLSSISEGQPLSVLESLAAGIPNITTNVGCCEEVLYGLEGDELGKAGIVVPVMNYKEMADAIIKILKDKKLHDDMSDVGRERVVKLYNKKDFIDRYREIYSSCKEGI